MAQALSEEEFERMQVRLAGGGAKKKQKTNTRGAGGEPVKHPRSKGTGVGKETRRGGAGSGSGKLSQRRAWRGVVVVGDCKGERRGRDVPKSCA